MLPPTIPPNPGKILIANYLTASIDIINPALCTGLNPQGSPWTLGNCKSGDSVFISGSEISAPKLLTYNVSCPNPAENGYVEICKQSDPEYPVTGIFDFTATAPLFSSGTIQVPVGECSGPVQVPAGQVTLTEAPTVGDLVSDVTGMLHTTYLESASLT